jgi:tetratricopeptide (TPR) repeat protein
MTQTARQLRSTHRQANLLAQEAWMAKEKGQFDRSLDLYQKAYQLEKEVAQGYLELLDAEPTRSIILKSAAVLAKECGELREAEKWLSHALSGNPSEEIAAELRVLFKEINKKHRKASGTAKVEKGILRVVEGILGMVDSTKHRIGVDAADGRVRIQVPQEANDMVLKFIDNPVKVTYQVEGRRKWLKQIQKAG